MQVRYSFSAPRATDKARNGNTYVYYDEKIETRTSTRKDEETGEDIEEKYTVYSYQRAEVGKKPDKGEIVNAIIRGGSMVYNDEGIERTIGPFSQSAAEAIIRHKLNGDDAGEFDDFNTFAEQAKAWAEQILQSISVQ